MILQIGNRKEGFTFIEVMISIGIISIGLVAITQTFATIINVLAISRHNVQSVLLLEEKIEELEELNRLENGTGEGSLGGSFTNYKNYKWSANISGVGNSENLKRMDFTLSWQAGRREGDLKVATYLLRVEEPEEEEK